MNKLTLAEDHLYGLTEYGDTDALEAIPDDLANLIDFTHKVQDVVRSDMSGWAKYIRVLELVNELEGK